MCKLFSSSDIADIFGRTEDDILDLLDLGATPPWTAEYPDCPRFWTAEDIWEWPEYLVGAGPYEANNGQ
jgi:hypothetical protein